MTTSSTQGQRKRKLDADSSEEKYTHKPPRKKIRKLPALKSISKLFTDNPKTSSMERNQNDGKQRRFAHEKGNWSVHVYIPVRRDKSMVSLFDSLSSSLVTKGNDTATVHRMEEHHISLSVCQPIRTHQIDDFVDSLRRLLMRNAQDHNKKQAFEVSFNALKFYSNETNSRHFGALVVEHGKQDIIDLVGVVNIAMKEWALQAYYDSPEPHMSFIWSLEEFEIDSKALQKLNQDIAQAAIVVPIDHAIIKIGDRSYKVQLST